MLKTSRKINLLPDKNNTLLNQFLGWAISIGRLLVILTETLALSVFIYRFSLDMQIIDLHDKIKTDSIIVQNFKDGESTYRGLHNRLAMAKTFDHEPDKTLLLLKELIELGRNRITFKNLIVSTDSVQIEIQSPSSANLSSFTNALKAHPQLEELTVERVENKTSNATITVVLSAVIKGAPKVSPTPGAPGVPGPQIEPPQTETPSSDAIQPE
jgi:hypothetical protein